MYYITFYLVSKNGKLATYIAMHIYYSNMHTLSIYAYSWSPIVSQVYNIDAGMHAWRMYIARS